MTEDSVEVHIVWAVDFYGDIRWNHPVNRYPYNTLYFVCDGDGSVTINGKKTLLESGYVYLIPSNTLFSCSCISHIHKLYVDVFAELVPGYDVFSDAEGQLLRIPYPVENIQKLCHAVAGGKLKHRMFLQGEVTRLLAEFLEEGYTPVHSEIVRYRPLLCEIDRELSAKLRVSDISRKYGWGPSVLSRSFKKVFHCNIKAYLDRLLMTRIRQELIDTDHSMKEIASRYQFCDPYYLSNFFKRHEGCSPSEYRKNNRKSL